MVPECFRRSGFPFGLKVFRAMLAGRQAGGQAVSRRQAGNKEMFSAVVFAAWPATFISQLLRRCPWWLVGQF